jgi:hypothetical protein
MDIGQYREDRGQYIKDRGQYIKDRGQYRHVRTVPQMACAQGTVDMPDTYVY